ncbi:DUF1002 domain-containing protein [Thermoanaerobacterium sp. RBIITD]|uniref:DUF1002 domain-containing protein n=1 Tax=Thermoanaerobacterium sp. RBIITD TaxID=1550240 RepID=UPI0012FD99D2
MKYYIDDLNRSRFAFYDIIIQEEHKYLGQILPENVIVSKAISSSLITFQEKGKGLDNFNTTFKNFINNNPE